VKLECSHPGCGRLPWLDPAKVRPLRRATLETVYSRCKGTCPVHGDWVVCETHRVHEAWDDLLGALRPYDCSLCAGEANAWWKGERDVARAEAERRNAAEARLSPPQTMEAAAAQFRADGYGAQAAEALARKQLRERAARPAFTESLMFDERREMRQKQRLAAGQAAVCPACERMAPASEGVILAHVALHSEGMGDAFPPASYRVCRGEGSIVPP
jgi:hypothetical protein